MKDYCGKSIAANYYRGIEAVGGKLIFDETGITFKSHALNIQTGESRIEYKDMLKDASGVDIQCKSSFATFSLWVIVLVIGIISN